MEATSFRNDCSWRIRPVLAAYIPKLIFVYFFSSYVGIVLEGDLMAIFVCDWRCKFSLMFLFVTEKKKFW